jgi:hypothetical protein
VVPRSATTQTETATGLFVVTISTREVEEILADTRLNPSDDWSPHGNLIIFSRHVTPNVRGSIWVINSDGSGLRAHCDQDA